MLSKAAVEAVCENWCQSVKGHLKMSSGLLETSLSYFLAYLTALWYLADRDSTVMLLEVYKPSVNILRRRA